MYLCDRTNAWCCLDKGVAYALHCARDMREDTVHYSEKGARYATKAIMPQSASLTQNMNIVHLKAQVSHSTRGTQWGPLKNAPPKPTVRTLTEPAPGVAWTDVLLGQGGGRDYQLAGKQARRTSIKNGVLPTGCQPGAHHRHHQRHHLPGMTRYPIHTPALPMTHHLPAPPTHSTKRPPWTECLSHLLCVTPPKKKLKDPAPLKVGPPLGSPGNRN